MSFCDFLEILDFSKFSLIGAFGFALILPFIGVINSVRNENIIGVAMPPIGASAISFLFLFFNHPNHFVMYLFSFFMILFAYLFATKKENTLRQKQNILLFIFVLGQTLTLLFASIGLKSGVNIDYILKGEILAFESCELFVLIPLTVVVIAVFYFFRGIIFTYAIDSLMLLSKSKAKSFFHFNFFKVLSVIVISASVMMMGFIFTISLMVIPAILLEKVSKSLNFYIIYSTILSVLGLLLGFSLAIFIDTPPVPVISVSLIVVILIYRFFYILKNVIFFKNN